MENDGIYPRDPVIWPVEALIERNDQKSGITLKALHGDNKNNAECSVPRPIHAKKENVRGVVSAQ